MVPGPKLPGRCLALVPLAPPRRRRVRRRGDGGAATAGPAAAAHDAPGGAGAEKKGGFLGVFRDFIGIDGEYFEKGYDSEHEFRFCGFEMDFIGI